MGEKKRSINVSRARTTSTSGPTSTFPSLTSSGGRWLTKGSTSRIQKILLLLTGSAYSSKRDEQLVFKICCPFFLQRIINDHIMTNTLMGKRIENINAIKRKLMAEVIQHKTEFDPNNLKDFIDVYLAQIENTTEEDFNVRDLTSCIYDFFLAGTETSSTTLKWILLFLTLHEDVQDRCREEIRKTVGNGQVSATDLPSFPYLQAFIAEVQRISFITPVSLKHSTTTVTKVDQFTFPEKSNFVINLAFIMNDPEYWDNPLMFNPDRFLTEDGRFTKNSRLIPFSVGRRYCMGEILARNEVFLFT